MAVQGAREHPQERCVVQRELRRRARLSLGKLNDGTHSAGVCGVSTRVAGGMFRAIITLSSNFHN